MHGAMSKCLVAAFTMAVAIAVAAAAEPAKAAKRAGSPAVPGTLAIAKQGYFFVGGSYVESKDGRIMAGQMFVQYQIPQTRKHKYPVVMWHGGGQTATNFLGTPDGRPGWADYFVSRGYAVYVVDQPARARSGYFTEPYGPTRRPVAKALSERFTAPELLNLYPQAKLHAQWPGKGTPGDAVFDEFFASQVEDMQDVNLMEDLNRKAGVALLEKIGPAILLTHSQSGPFGWQVADMRPELVKAVGAVEPNGPPFYESITIGAPEWFKDGPIGRAWGITRLPLNFHPPVAEPKELGMTLEDKADGEGLVRCWVQAQPAHRLPRLQKTPIVIVTGEASFRATYDHCTSKFLTQAGVKHSHVRLGDVAIKGNGHMMMLEKNNLEIAAFLDRWIAKNAR
jgi:pimeloyl-ACP methyl ester carboxylesterase